MYNKYRAKVVRFVLNTESLAMHSNILLCKFLPASVLAATLENKAVRIARKWTAIPDIGFMLFSDECFGSFSKRFDEVCY